MKPEIHNPFFFYRGHRFEGVVGIRNEFQHTFGASGGFTVNGQPVGKRGLHQLLTLDTGDPVLTGIFSDIPRLPLFYGFHYESGLVEYRLTDTSTIAITSLDESSYDVQWPYEGYPETFPVHSLTLTPPTPCDLATFERDVWQGIDRHFADCFIAIIPPSDAYGVNLWRPRNNLDSIHVKCFVNPTSKEVVIYNECD